jgi:hypothetical protein
VSRTIGADKACAVDGEAHRKFLDRDVMHDLIVAALQEGGVDRAERLETFGGEACGESHRVLLGDADIEGALREDLFEQVDAGAAGHCRRDGDDLVILLRFRIRLWPNTAVYDGALDFALACLPVSTSNLATA